MCGLIARLVVDDQISPWWLTGSTIALVSPWWLTDRRQGCFLVAADSELTGVCSGLVQTVDWCVFRTCADS